MPCLHWKVLRPNKECLPTLLLFPVDQSGLFQGTMLCLLLIIELLGGALHCFHLRMQRMRHLSSSTSFTSMIAILYKCSI